MVDSTSSADFEEEGTIWTGALEALTAAPLLAGSSAFLEVEAEAGELTSGTTALVEDEEVAGLEPEALVLFRLEGRTFCLIAGAALAEGDDEDEEGESAGGTDFETLKAAWLTGADEGDLEAEFADSAIGSSGSILMLPFWVRFSSDKRGRVAENLILNYLLVLKCINTNC
jgi:hypothetical protein